MTNHGLHAMGTHSGYDRFTQINVQNCNSKLYFLICLAECPTVQMGKLNINILMENNTNKQYRRPWSQEQSFLRYT